MVLGRSDDFGYGISASESYPDDGYINVRNMLSTYEVK